MAIRSFPTVSYAEILAGTVSPEEILDTLAATGYFYLSDLDQAISPQLLKSLQGVSEKFFDLPAESKMQYYIGDSDNHRGYVPVTEQGAYGDESIRTYEAFDLGYDCDPLPAADSLGFELVGPNRYPGEVAGMTETLRAYYGANFEISRQLLRLIARGSGLDPDHFEPRITRPASQLRLIHYLPNDVLLGRDDTSMGAHTDYELFTLIHQTSPGLLAYDRETRTWHNMPVFKDTVLVLVGDMLQFLTGGRLKSLLHRVVTTGEERFSFPFFMNLDFETELGVLPHFGHSDEKVVVGHHLLGQLYRDFPYIKERIDSGKWLVDFDIPDSNVFEHQN
ncbi:isopenicillin N synthase family dioxygenase [Streptomyces sp. NPDC059989]|uniref:isopenicillin N synthase family dioxygenase n=1 Tax=Streptomyces sp. NPDC059989 TaxID=3347026 RepID=UPI0036CF39FB